VNKKVLIAKDPFVEANGLQRAIIEKLKTMLMLHQKLINSKLSITVPVNELKRIDKSAGLSYYFTS
jgi:hypothetical protein